MRVGLFALLLGAGILVVGGCAALWVTGMPGASFEGELPALTEEGEELARRLRGHVTTLAGTIGERNWPSYESLAKARDYVAGELREAGYEPALRPFRYRGETFHNVEAALPGTGSLSGSVVAGAHYDTVEGSPGANDNASGVAVLLELARKMRGYEPPVDVRFVAFANEEAPYFNRREGMGSAVYARDLAGEPEPVRAMLSIETVGFYRDEPGSQRLPFLLGFFYPDRGNFVAFVGDLDARAVVRRAVAAFRSVATLPSEGVAAPAMIPGVLWSDHRSFRELDIPALMVTDTAFYRYPHYHLATDTPERLDYGRMARLVEGLAGVVTALADGGARDGGEG